MGDTYYAVGTGKAPDGKQFPILRSRNFTDWEVVGGAMDAIEGIMTEGHMTEGQTFSHESRRPHLRLFRIL